MTQELNLDALASTLSDSLDEQEVRFEEAEGYLSFNVLEGEPPGSRPIRPRSREFRLPRPRTIQEAFDWAVEAGIVEDSGEERDDFLWKYKHYETLPPHLR